MVPRHCCGRRRPRSGYWSGLQSSALPARRCYWLLATGVKRRPDADVSTRLYSFAYFGQQENSSSLAS